MTLYIDSRGGSCELPPHIRPHKVPVQTVHGLDGDFEFMGYGPGDLPIAIGGEHKKISECLTSMSDGRLTGTQAARMLQSYQRVYLVIQGRTRIAKDGTLEYFARKERNKEIWYTAYSRSGAGWQAYDFFARIASLEEFLGIRVHLTEDAAMSGALLAFWYRYWQKFYSDHKSWAQWDQSGTGRNTSNLMMPTSNLPIVTRWAREIRNIGQHKAHYVGSYFKTAANMVLAGKEEWSKVEWKEKIKRGPKAGSLQTKRFSEESVDKILAEIWGQQ